MSRVDAIDAKKTKQELLGELTTMRQRLAELETLVSRGDQAVDAPNRLEGWFQTLFECAPDAYYLNTLEAQFVDGNHAAETLLGYQREELIGKSFLEANLLSSDQLPKAAGLLMKSSQGQPTGPDELVLTRKDGTQVAVEIRTVPAELDGQTLVLGIARDITERKRMEEKFREAEEQYRTLIENATDAIVVAQNGHIVYRNPADLKLLGYTDEELAAQDFLAWVVPEDRARIRRYQQQRLQGKPTPSQYEITIITRDGRRIPVELKPRVIQYRGQPATLVMMRDMTARKHAEEALQKAHDELERKVAERTAELAKANEELRAEIAERQRTEEALRASEEKYRDLVENMNDQIFCVDEAGKITYISPVAEAISGYQPSEVIGRPFEDFIYPEDLESVRESFQQMLLGQLKFAEFRIVTKSGSLRWMRGSNRPVWEDGQVVGLQGILTDITDKKEAEEALRERQYFIEKIADTTPMILYLYDYTEQRNVYVNKQVSAILGYTPEDIALMGSEMAARLLHPDDMLGITKHEQLRDMADGEVREYEYRMRHAEGEWRWLQSRETVFSRTPTGAVKVVLGTAQDITERKRIEKQLQDSEQRWQYALAGNDDGVWDWDQKANSLFFSKRWKTMLGYAEDELEASYSAWETRIHPADRDQVLLLLNAHLEGKTPQYVSEHRLRCKDGTYKWILDRGKVLTRTAAGEPLRIVGTHTDITARKQMERDLQFTRFAVQNAAEGMLRFDVQGRILAMNDTLCQQHGYSHSELLSMRIFSLAPDDSPEMWSKRWQEVQQQQTLVIETHHRRKNGHLFPVEVSMNYFEFGGEAFGFAFIRDITQSRQAEDALRASEARYAGIFHNTADPIFLVGVNADGTFVYEEFNPPQEALTGLSSEEVRGKTPAECFSSDTASHITERYTACLEAGEALRYEEEVDLPQGIGHRVVQTVLAPIRDASDRVYRLVGIARDITERKRAEKKLQETNQRLEDALAERRTLSTALRHVQEHERRHLAQELHDGVAQTLSGILMHVDLLDSQLQDKQLNKQLKYDEIMTQIHTLLENAIDEVRDLAWTLRPGVLDDLGLTDALPGLVMNMTKNVPIKTRLRVSPRLPALPSETETALYRITQEALSNILKHAQASAISVRLHRKKACVVLTVTDDGRGLPQSQDACIDPKKRGLGLWSMRERAEEVGGTFSLESTPHKGTKILVTVPAPPARDTTGAPQ